MGHDAQRRPLAGQVRSDNLDRGIAEPVEVQAGAVGLHPPRAGRVDGALQFHVGHRLHGGVQRWEGGRDRLDQAGVLCCGAEASDHHGQPWGQVQLGGHVRRGRQRHRRDQHAGRAWQVVGEFADAPVRAARGRPAYA
jgi:hypothetical protein